MEIIYIKWEDHWSEDQSWTHIKKLRKKQRKHGAYIVETVGFLLGETEETVMVGLSVASDGMVDGNIVILKKNIVEREVLMRLGNCSGTANEFSSTHAEAFAEYLNTDFMRMT